MRAVFALAASAAVALLVSGCGKPADRVPTKKMESTTIRVSDFTLKSLDGSTVSLGDFLGKTIVLIEFSEPGCEYCAMALPTIKKIHETRGDKVKVLDIDENDKAGDFKAEVAERGIKHTVLLDPDGAVQEQYGVEGYPTFVLIGLDRKVLYAGYDPDELYAVVEAAVK